MANLPTQNNNPGDLKNPSTGGFDTFSDPQQGFGALLNDLQTKINNHPDHTLADFSNQYAPSSDNNDSAGYAAKLANQLGVSPNATIGSLEPEIGKFAEAVSKNEGYEGAPATSPVVPTAQASGGTDTSSDTPWLDGALGIGAAAVGGLGLLAANIFAPEAALPVEEAATGGGVLGALGTAAEVKGGLDTASGLYSSFSGNSGGSAQAPQPQNQQQNTTEPQPTNQSISPSFQSVAPTTAQELEQQMPQATQASTQVGQGQAQMMNNLPTGRVMMQDPLYQSGIAANARYGNVGTSDENGNYDASGTEERANKQLEQIDNGEQDVFRAEGATGSIGEGLQEAQKNNEKYVAVPDQEAANEHANNILQSYAKKYADKDGNIPLHRWHQIAKEQGNAFDRNASSAKNAASKSVSAAARSVIKKNTYHKDFYEKMQKEKQAIIKGKEINEKLNGKKIPKNKSFLRDLLKQSGGALGIYLGDKIGGPLGAILGNMVGEKISRAADKRHGRNIFETKGMKKALAKLEKESPATYQVLEREIKKAWANTSNEAKRREAIPKLSAPKSIPLGARKGKDESIVTGGKTPPATFAQAVKRKRGEPEYGGLYEYYQHIKDVKKAAGINQK